MISKYVKEINWAAQGATMKAEKIFKENFGFDMPQMSSNALQIAIYHIYEAAVVYKERPHQGEYQPIEQQVAQ